MTILNSTENINNVEFSKDLNDYRMTSNIVQYKGK